MTCADPVLGYCERTVPGAGAEPFNTLTGLGFLVVGLWAFRAEPRVEDRQAALALALVGIASALHHGLAIRATLWVDVLANQLYLALLGRLMLRRLAGAGQAVALLGGAVGVALANAVQAGPLIALGPALWPLRDLFVLELLLLLALVLGLRARHAGTAGALALAAVMLALGLPFRILDASLCPVWPLGTHGLWHLANAGATALLLAGLARHQARS